MNQVYKNLHSLKKIKMKMINKLNIYYNNKKMIKTKIYKIRIKIKKNKYKEHKVNLWKKKQVLKNKKSY